jgi:PAS domain S-box-containing protein
VQRDALRAARTMPGGGLRFRPHDIEAYAGRVASKRRPQSVATLLQLPPDPPANYPALDNPVPTHQPPTRPQAVQPDDTVVAGLERLSIMANGSLVTVEDHVADILALLAESLEVGLVCLARSMDGAWQLEACHDRMGMAFRSGASLPFSDVYGDDLREGRLYSVIVADVHADARFAGLAAATRQGIGALTLVSLHQPEGALYGVLCTMHPYARSVPNGEPALLRLAGRMVMHAREAAALRAAEQQAARRLAASEARFRALCDHSADFIRIVDAGGIIRYANSSHERLLGYRAAELVGQSAFALMHPDDVPAMRLLLDQTLHRAGTFCRGELRMRHADGSWRTLEVVLHNHLDDPDLQGVLSNGRDFSERVHAKD